LQKSQCKSTKWNSYNEQSVFKPANSRLAQLQHSVLSVLWGYGSGVSFTCVTGSPRVRPLARTRIQLTPSSDSHHSSPCLLLLCRLLLVCCYYLFAVGCCSCRPLLLVCLRVHFTLEPNGIFWICGAFLRGSGVDFYPSVLRECTSQRNCKCAPSYYILITACRCPDAYPNSSASPSTTEMSAANRIHLLIKLNTSL